VPVELKRLHKASKRAQLKAALNRTFIYMPNRELNALAYNNKYKYTISHADQINTRLSYRLD